MERRWRSHSRESLATIAGRHLYPAHERGAAMRPALLIAGNFLRENRWPVILLFLWGVGSGIAGALTVGSSLDDALFLLKQQAVYSVFFTVFLSASALYNQRRSRRILAVLSKGIERYEYLDGIVVGFSAVSFFYSVALGVTGAWTFAR